jgi:Mg2+ and Co2+ transporter CorA
LLDATSRQCETLTIFEKEFKLNFVVQDPHLWISLVPPKGKEVPQLSKLPKVSPSFPPVVNKAKKEITCSGRNPER